MKKDIKIDNRGSKYTDAQRRQAVLNYAVLGNIQRVADVTGIPYGTIFEWYQNADWWELLLKDVQEEKQAELDALCTDTIHKAVEEASHRVTDEEERKSIKFMDLIKGATFLFNQRQLIRNQPTSIKDENTNSVLQTIADRLGQISEARIIEGEVIKD